MAHEERLNAIQAELQRLKQVHGKSLSLSRGKGSEAPFPIAATLDVAAPSDAYAYDDSGFQVEIMLQKDQADPELHVVSKEIPGILQRNIERHIAASCTGAARIFAACFEYAQSHFLDLIISLPELVESYESVDANGASARRYMINDPGSHLEAEVILPKPARLQAQLGVSQDLSNTPVKNESRARGEEEGDKQSRLQQDLAYMQRRYRSAFASTPSPEGQSATHFHLSLSPTDPKWQAKVPLQLKGLIESGYPAVGSLKLSIVVSAGLTAEVCQTLDQIVAAEIFATAKSAESSVNRVGLLPQLVRKLENSASEYLQLAEDLLVQRQRKASQTKSTARDLPEGLAAVSLEDSRADPDQNGNASSSAEVLTSDWTEDDESSSQESADEEGAGKLWEANGMQGSHGIIEVQLSDLKLDNVDVIQPLALQIQVACNRCSQSWEVSLTTEAVSVGGSDHTGDCPNCNQQWDLDMRPLLVHAYNSSIAHLRPQNCKALDLLPSTLSAQCGSCSNVATFRSVQVGQVSGRTCSQCHLKMGISFGSALFVPREAKRAVKGPQNNAAASSPGTKTKSSSHAGEAAVVVGQPLPQFGTCRHYPHSHRWLRFPCCGRRFSCDVCHEEETDGHDMQWAVRHVCGFCSTEQKIDDRCGACHKRLAFHSAGAIGSNTRHWEGGQGCRDKRRLDRRDKAKYRGSKHKTVSKKAYRVGKEGAKKGKKPEVS